MATYIVNLYPVGQTTCQFNVYGAGFNYRAVDEIEHNSDTDYVYVKGEGAFIDRYVFDISSIPLDAEISEVRFFAVKKTMSNTPTANSWRFYVQVEGLQGGYTIGYGTPTQNYQLSQAAYDFCPQTQLPWTRDNLINLRTGPMASNSFSEDELRVTQYYIQITYTSETPTIICYRCHNDIVETDTFDGTECPDGWSIDIPVGCGVYPPPSPDYRYMIPVLLISGIIIYMIKRRKT